MTNRAVELATSVPAVVTGPTDWASGALVEAALSSLGEAFVKAALAMSSAAIEALTATTTVDLSATWFRRNVGVIAVVTLPVLVGLFVVQVATSVLRREPGGLVRAVLGVGKATVGSALAIAVTQSALIATDGVCEAIAAASGTSVAAAAARFLQLTSLSSGQTGPVLKMLFGAMMIIGSMMLWAVLLFRKAALVVVAVFAPVAFAGSIWDATRSWTRRWVEAVAALVLCKIVIVVVFVVGASAFSQIGPAAGSAPTAAPGSSPSAAQGLSDLLIGMLLLTMATLSPWVTWRFLHWAGAEAAGALTGAVAASPIPGSARAAGQLVRFSSSYMVGQGSIALLGRLSGRSAGAGTAGSGGAAPPNGGGGAPAGGPGSDPRRPTPGGAPGSPARPPAGAASSGWSPPATRVRRAAP